MSEAYPDLPPRPTVPATEPPPATQAISGGTEPVSPGDVAVIVVDHGSRRAESNRMLLEVVAQFREGARYGIVEPAHMELAEPSIASAFDRCVEQGARLVVVFPYFLLPGRHWHQDIPALATAAARRHPGVPFLVAAPLGLHPLMLEIMDDRIQHCLRRAQGQQDEACPMCRESDPCRLRTVVTDTRPTEESPANSQAVPPQ